MRVPIRYEFTVIAGRGSSSPQSLAQEAERAARTFFGDLVRFDVEMTVRGKSPEYYIECVATADLQVDTGSGLK